MEEQQEVLDSGTNEQEKPTNWRAWYWGLAIFLIAQIILFTLISNSFGE
jgi:choline-glycine betaine transporter